MTRSRSRRAVGVACAVRRLGGEGRGLRLDSPNSGMPNGTGPPLFVRSARCEAASGKQTLPTGYVILLCSTGHISHTSRRCRLVALVSCLTVALSQWKCGAAATAHACDLVRKS